MKGPYGRLRFDVLRLWQCPICHRFERTSGAIVILGCRVCRARPESGDVWMKLVEGPPDAPETKPQPAAN